MTRGPRTTFADQGPASTVTIFQITRKISPFETCHFRIISRNKKAIFRENFSSLRGETGKIFEIISFSRGPRTTYCRRIWTTFILGTALLNFGTRANNIGHGPLDFCRVKANFSARVPKNLGGPRPPQEVVSARLKRGPRAETGGILVPTRVFAPMTGLEGEGSGLENELWGTKILYFSQKGNYPVRVRKKVKPQRKRERYKAWYS